MTSLSSKNHPMSRLSFLLIILLPSSVGGMGQALCTGQTLTRTPLAWFVIWPDIHPEKHGNLNTRPKTQDPVLDPFRARGSAPIASSFVGIQGDPNILKLFRWNNQPAILRELSHAWG